jgi:hypothetical protein
MHTSTLGEGYFWRGELAAALIEGACHQLLGAPPDEVSGGEPHERRGRAIDLRDQL